MKPLRQDCTVPRRGLRPIAGCLLALLVLAGPALAEEPSAEPGVTKADAQRLLETLKDDTRRQALVNDLEVLITVLDTADDDAPKSAGATILETLSGRMERLGDALTSLTGEVADVPGLVAIAAGQLSDADARSTFLRALFQLAVIVASGLAALWVANRLLRTFRQSLNAHTGSGPWMTWFLALIRAFLGVIAIAAFVAAAYAAMTVLAPGRTVKVLALALINASALAQVVLLLARTLLAPDVSPLRLIRVGDETANYIVIWLRRLVYVFAYGYFLTEAMAVLGMAPVTHSSVVKLVGLTLTLMLIVLTLQNRLEVARAIRGDARGLLGQLRRRIADIWHLVTILYVFAIFGVWALEVPGGFDYVLRSTGLSLLAIVIAGAALVLVRSLLRRAFSLSEDQKARFPGLEARASRYLPFLVAALQFAVAATTVLTVLNIWGANAFSWMTTPLGSAVVKGLANITVVIVISLVIWELVSAAIERYLSAPDSDGNTVERGQRAMTLLPLMRNIVMVALAILVTLTALSEIGVNIGPLIAGAGILGLAIGFGAQTFVKDVITGFFILIEDAVAVGDIVILGGYAGKVEAISIRSIQLRDLKGDVHRIPFSEVTSTTNRSKIFSFAFFDIGVAYRENVDRCMEVIRDVGARIREDETFGPMILEDIEIMGVQSFDDSAVVIRARIKVQPGKQLGVQRAFNRLMKLRFDEEGIEIPFPHRTLYFGDDGSGSPPPARVQIEKA